MRKSLAITILLLILLKISRVNLESRIVPFSQIDGLNSLHTITQEAKSECTEALSSILTQFKTNPAALNLLLKSGKGINDLGDFVGCVNSEYNRYVLLRIDGLPISIQLGICGPINCTTKDYDTLKPQIANLTTEFTKSMGSGINMNISEENINFLDSKEIKETKGRPGAGFVLNVMIYIILIVAGITGYIYYRVRGHNITTTKSRIISCFNMSEHFDSIFTPREGDPNLRVIDGIRILSCWWIILGHVFYYLMMYGPLSNPTAVMDLVSTYKYAFVYSSTLAVDNFFLFSAFLMSHKFLRQLRDAARTPHGIRFKTFMLLYLHRLLRLYPVLFFALFYWWCILPYVGFAPNYGKIFHFQDSCRSLWPYEIFWLNNFITQGQGACIGWTWYLANDMQMFIFCSFILLLYFHHPKLGLLLIGLVASISTIIIIIIAVTQNISASWMKFNFDYYDNYYTKPYCRINTYLMGLLLGIVYDSWINKKKNIVTRILHKMTKSNICINIIYIISAVILFNMLQMMYYLDKYYKSLTKAQDTAYLTLSRPAFTLGILLLILPTILGRGGGALGHVVKLIFAQKYYVGMSKLTYGIYVIHPQYVMIFVFALKTTMAMNVPVNFLLFWAFMAVAFLTSLLVHMFIEGPILAIEKMFIMPKSFWVTQEDTHSMDLEEQELIDRDIDNIPDSDQDSVGEHFGALDKGGL